MQREVKAARHSVAFVLLLATMAGAQTGSTGASDAGRRDWDFASDTPRRIPKGFVGAVGTWEVVADADNRVLAQKAKSADSTFNIVLISDTSYADLDLSVRMKAVAGEVDQGGGLVWRATDAKNYYLARYNPLEDNFRVYKVQDGTRTQFQSAKVGGDRGWHTLRITMVGTKITCYLDGKKYLEVEDSTFPKPGKIGVWSKADAQSYFDDLTVSPPRPDLAEQLPKAAEHQTREFEIRGDRPFLGGHPIDLWGLRCGNALYSTAVTERHINNLDNMVAHGINCLGVYIQGANAGWPDAEAGLDGFRRDGRLKPEVARRLEWLIREADKRGMVVMVGVLSPRKDQDLYDEAAIRRAIEEAGRFLVDRNLKNVFVDLMHEFDQPDRIDHALLREPDGANKKAKLTGWFKAVAPDIEAGICPTFKSDPSDEYPGMDVRIIQKDMPIPSQGFVVNVETQRQDVYENDGVFNPGARAAVDANCQAYMDAPNAVMLFHAAFIQGLSNASKTAPHPEMGGYGTGPDDRGVRFYYEWVRDHVGRWEYPRHIKSIH
jgi:hypothetical protein